MITQQQISEIFEYTDGALYWKKPAHKSKEYLTGTLAGSIHKTGYRHITLFNRIEKAHRLIFMLHHGYVPNEIDHINGDRSDNRIENLRETTRSQNQYNKGMCKSNTSGHRGVSWHRKSNAWQVRVDVAGKRHMIGYFKDLDAAAAAAKEARERLHGEFAKAA